MAEGNWEAKESSEAMNKRELEKLEMEEAETRRNLPGRKIGVDSEGGNRELRKREENQIGVGGRHKYLCNKLKRRRSQWQYWESLIPTLFFSTVCTWHHLGRQKILSHDVQCVISCHSSSPIVKKVSSSSIINNICC